MTRILTPLCLGIGIGHFAVDALTAEAAGQRVAGAFFVAFFIIGLIAHLASLMQRAFD